MHRTACVDLPAFPLQLLLLRHPDWRDLPAAVVDNDRPQGVILWVNERARARRILPGMRFAAALSLAGELRAGVVSPSEIERATAAMARRLCRHTPHVEVATGEAGVFWLDASGLERLHPSLTEWCGQVRSALKQEGFRATVVVGFNRFGSYALARSKRGGIVLRTAAEERAAACRVPLDRLDLKPAARDALRKLGVVTVGEFVDLPVEGIERRFGKRALELRRLAAGEFDRPLQPDRPLTPALQRLDLDHAETDVGRLMLVVERLLHPLLRTLADRNSALTELGVGFRFERLGDHIESIRPAAPTLDAKLLLELTRLRLQAQRRLPDGVVELVLTARESRATRRQLQLFAGKPKRDLAAADRALARVRAELGDAAVRRARLNPGHLPEAHFQWDEVDKLPASRPRVVEQNGRLVRRIHLRPVPLPPRPRHEPDGWMLSGLKQGPVVRVNGPYVVSGGWWHKKVHREYHFAETQQGELLWVYYDRPRRRWFMQGRVE